MNRRGSLLLIVLGAAAVALAALDYAASTSRADRMADDLMVLHNRIRAGASELTPDEEWNLLERKTDEAKAAALARLRVAGLFGVLLLAGGLVFLSTRQEVGPPR